MTTSNRREDVKNLFEGERRYLETGDAGSPEMTAFYTKMYGISPPATPAKQPWWKRLFQ